MARDDQVDSDRSMRPPRESFMVEMDELMEPNMVGDEIAKRQVVGPNAPLGPVTLSYTVGGRGGPTIPLGVDEPD